MQLRSIVLVVALFNSESILADDGTFNSKLEFGKTILEMGVATGSLISTSQSSNFALAEYPKDEIYQLATRIQTDLDNANASSAFGRSVGNAGAAGMALIAAGDLEPTSRICFTVAAYATTAATNYLADSTYREVQQQSLGMLRKALDEKSNHLTATNLAAMDKNDIPKMIDDLIIGGKKMREVFKDNPDALEMLKANINDFLVSNSAATLFTVKQINGSVEAARKAIVEVNDNLKEFRAESSKRLASIEEKTDALLLATKESSEQLAELRKETKGNSRAIQTLSDISYLGWTTEQKLMAVRNGQFPELKGKPRDDLLKILESDMHREQVIGELQLASRDISSLTTLATNLHMPQDLVTALNDANTVTASLIKFSSGDMLGTAASLSGLFGGQRSDPAAERHKQLMNYLSQQFGQINERLENIQRLQKQTLEAVVDLSKFMSDFRNEVHQQLATIENEVLTNSAMLDEIIAAEWASCRAMRNASNHLPWFSSRDEIIDALGPGDNGIAFRKNWRECNAKSFQFLAGDIVTGNWAGGIVDLKTSAGPKTSDPDTQKALKSYADLRIDEYKAARDVLLVATPDLYSSPAQYLIRLGQPSPSVAARDALIGKLSSNSAKIADFKCNSKQILNLGLRKLVCVNVAPGTPQKPLSDQVERIYGDILIGPNGWSLMDSMIYVSRTAAFVRADANDQYKFLAPEDIDATRAPNSNLKSTISQHRGVDLLNAMMPMAELNILQQSIAYGDLVPQKALEILFDSKSNTFRTEVDPSATQEIQTVQTRALRAMRVNPILARNTVMLAVRKALTGSDGNFPKTYYNLALNYFRGAPACSKDPVAAYKLSKLFPSWKLEYRRDGSSIDTDNIKDCAPEESNSGTGLVLSFGNFYVRMPSPAVADEGVFEYPQSLAIALRYREKIAQELIDRNVYTYFNNDTMKVEFLEVASQIH